MRGSLTTVRHDGAKRRLRCNKANSKQPCCTRDEGWPLGPGLQDQGPNHRKLRRHNGWGSERCDTSSSGGGSHPSALTEPDVKLSPHPAPTLRPPVARRARVAWKCRKALPQTPAPPLSGWPISSAGVSGPFAPPALPGFIATTDPSVPALRIGTRLLAVPPLGGLPWHRSDRFPRSAQEPLAGLTPSSCRSPLGQSAGFLRASSQTNNWSLVSATFQRFRHVLNGSLAFVLPAHT